MAWRLFGTAEFFEWFNALSENNKGEMVFKLELLREFGPALKRPHADTLRDSKISNLKELRGKTAESVLRATFIFDKTRNGILIIGGDKKGVGEDRFYQNLIAESERLLEKYKDYQWDEEKDAWSQN